MGSNPKYTLDGRSPCQLKVSPLLVSSGEGPTGSKGETMQLAVAPAVNTSQQVEVRDDYIPTSNKDLVRVYSTYVARLVMRHNRVSSNFEDLLQHVWLKLFENDIITKHRSSLGHLPKQLSGAQATAYLRMPWFSFLKRVRRGVMKERLYLKAFARDAGVCTRCKCNTVKYAAAVNHLRTSAPEEFALVEGRLKKALGADALPDRYWVLSSEESDAKTLCLFCAKKFSVKAVTFRWYPVPAKGTWSSRQAVYDREDIERLKLVLEHEKDRTVDPDADPSSVLSKSLFKQYLARTVHNIYANWCRTRDRRYKEQYRGNDEATGRSWEETLGDPAGPRQETMTELSMVVQYLAGGGDPGEATEESASEVIEMFEAGRTIQDVARKMQIRPKVLQSYTGQG